jgi:hypothetical protein
LASFGLPQSAPDAVLAVDKPASRLVALDALTSARHSAVDVAVVTRCATPLLDGATAVLWTMDGVVEVALRS